MILIFFTNQMFDLIFLEQSFSSFSFGGLDRSSPFFNLEAKCEWLKIGREEQTSALNKI